MKRSILIVLFTIAIANCFSQSKSDTLLPAFKKGSVDSFFLKSIIYPKDALQAGISGQVYLKFMIDTNGVVKDVVVIKGASTSFNKEAIRVVKASSGMWTSGSIKGRKVPMWSWNLIFFKKRE